MKNLSLTILMIILGAIGLKAQGNTDSQLGLPGDNLNLFAVMDLFQESETLEAFEKNLNDPERMINNLDLRGNGYVDYIMVQDYPHEEFHNVVLRVAMGQDDFQDVAVFVIHKLADGSVRVQLIGDEALYGPDYIVEPRYAETPNPAYQGNITQTTSTQTSQSSTKVVHTTYYEVAHWPVITYIHRPTYRPYRSVYYYGYYPPYWNPWRVHYWHYYHGYHYSAPYHVYYRPYGHHRCGRYHSVYYANIRHHSPVVVVNINKGTYRNTYSRPEARAEGQRTYTQRNPGGSTVGRNIESSRQRPSQGDRQIDRNQTRPQSRENTERGRYERPAPNQGRATQPDRTGRSRQQGSVQDRETPPERQSPGNINRSTNRNNNEGLRTPPARDTNRGNTETRPTRNTNRNNTETRPAGNTNRSTPEARPARNTNRSTPETRPARNTRQESQPATGVRSGSSNNRNSGVRSSGSTQRRSSGNVGSSNNKRNQQDDSSSTTRTRRP